MSERRRYELRAFDGNGNVSAEMVVECDAWTSDSSLCHVFDSLLLYGEAMDNKELNPVDQWRAVDELMRDVRQLEHQAHYEMDVFEIERRVAKTMATTKKGGSK